MSLISEALRKARQEAAEREAQERGLESPVVAGYWKRGGRMGPGLVMGAVIAIGAAMIGGALVWWVLADREDSRVVRAAAEVVEVPGQVSDEPTGPLLDQRISGATPEETVPTVSPEPEPARAGEDSVQPQTGNGAGIDVPEPTPGRVEPSPVEGPKVLPESDDGEFVGQADIGEVTLTLDYLVFRKENPFAQINGRDVRVGAVIEDFVVEEINPNAVVLTRGDDTIVLRVQ